MDSDYPALDSPPPEPQISPPPRKRLSLGRALIALVVAFLLAQLAGKLAGDIARAIVHARPGSLVGPVVVPAVAASELALMLVSLLAPLVSELPVRDTLGLWGGKLPVFVAASLGTVMLGPLGDELMTIFTRLFPSLTLGIVPALHGLARSIPLLWFWPVFALLPGIAEELLFRGVLQRSIVRPTAAVLVSGIGFALFHVDPVHVIGVLPLGLFLAWVAQRSSTTVSIVAHVFNNGIAPLVIKSGAADVGFAAEQPLPLSWLAFSLCGFALAAFVVSHNTRRAHGTG